MSYSKVRYRPRFSVVLLDLSMPILDGKLSLMLFTSFTQRTQELVQR